MIHENRAEDGNAATAIEDNDNDNGKKKITEKLSTGLSLLILAFCFCIFGLVHFMDGRLPRPLTLEDAQVHPEKFIEERARDHLKQLTSVGPRPAGSYENEVLAVDLIRRRLEAIQKKAKSTHTMQIGQVSHQHLLPKTWPSLVHFWSIFGPFLVTFGPLFSLSASTDSRSDSK